MQIFILTLSILPMRSEARHPSEMVSQLLYGEKFIILDRLNNWKKIKTLHDNYEGWIDCPDFYISLFSYQETQPHVLFQDVANVQINNQKHLLIKGSYIYPSEVSLNIENHKTFTESHITDIASSYLNTPYLWGGKTPFGIDCSGFTQMVYRFININLPRDASQQVFTGREIDHINKIKAGDLAFFENDSKKITHVGLIINNQQIIHASGKVRIDKIDSEGIYCEENSSYSHKLSKIRRILL